MRKKYDRPYFITRHAVERFREHICDLPRDQIINIIINALQTPRPIEGVHGIYYGGLIRDKPMYIPVEIPLKHRETNWPIVPTILGPESSIHRKIMTERRKRDESRETRKKGDKGNPHS